VAEGEAGAIAAGLSATALRVYNSQEPDVLVTLCVVVKAVAAADKHTSRPVFPRPAQFGILPQLCEGALIGLNEFGRPRLVQVIHEAQEVSPRLVRNDDWFHLTGGAFFFASNRARAS
jgi:hypothetical protein